MFNRKHDEIMRVIGAGVDSILEKIDNLESMEKYYRNHHNEILGVFIALKSIFDILLESDELKKHVDLHTRSVIIKNINRLKMNKCGCYKLNYKRCDCCYAGD